MSYQNVITTIMDNNDNNNKQWDWYFRVTSETGQGDYMIRLYIQTT